MCLSFLGRKTRAVVRMRHKSQIYGHLLLRGADYSANEMSARFELGIGNVSQLVILVSQLVIGIGNVGQLVIV